MINKKVQIDELEFHSNDLSDSGISNLYSLQFVTDKLTELQNMEALLTRAKNSYISGLKKEILANKSGILFEDID